MNTKSFKVVFALSFSILCGILVGKNISHFIGVSFGWILGCVTTLITGLLFYEPAEVVKYFKEASVTTKVWLESKKNQEITPKRFRELLRKKRIKRARHLAMLASVQYSISTYFDRLLFCSSWCLLGLFFLHGDVLHFIIIIILFFSISSSTATFGRICIMKPIYRERQWFFEEKTSYSFSSVLDKDRGWHFLTITKTHNPVSVIIRLLCTVSKNRMRIILSTGIFLLEMLKKLNSHERIVIAVFGVTFCLVGLIVDVISPNNFVGPLTGLIGGIIFGMIEQIFYNHISSKINAWIDDMRASRSLLES